MYPTSSNSETETAKIASAAEPVIYWIVHSFLKATLGFRKVATEISDQL